MRTISLALGLLTALSSVACKAANPTVPYRAPAPSTHDPLQAASAAPVASEAKGAAGAAESALAESSATSSETATPKVPEPVVARVGDERIYVSELLSTWMLVDGEGLRDLLGTLVTEHLVRKESKRLAIGLQETDVASEMAQALGEMEKKLQLEQPGMSLDEWIAGGLGLDPTRFRKGMRDDVESRLLAERVVRYFIMTQESAEVSVIVCATEQEAKDAMGRVQAGEAFARIATELSIDPSGKRGGRIPPVIRNDSALARLAFGTAVGEVGGPLGESERWMLLQTRKLNAPLVGGWKSIGAQVEANLLERPIEQAEYWLWKSEMNKRHPADFEPFFELIDEPAVGGSL